MNNPEAPRNSSILNEDTEHEAEMEILCRHCGLCCHNKVPLANAGYVVHPSSSCQYLGENGHCQIYSQRFKINPSCLTRDQMVEKDYVLPEGCPYARLRKGYKTARVVTGDEFDRLMALDVLLNLSQTQD